LLNLALRLGLLWDDLRMLLSVVSTLVRNLITVPAAVLRGRVAKDAEVLALRHENAVLRRQIARVRYEPGDRIWLSVLSRLIPRQRWRYVFAVTPATLLRWHRQLLARKWTFAQGRRPVLVDLAPRLPSSSSSGDWHGRMAPEATDVSRVNLPAWDTGVPIVPSTVWQVLHAAGIDPAPQRSGPTWRQFLTA
jgi:putative transposase